MGRPRRTEICRGGPALTETMRAIAPRLSERELDPLDLADVDDLALAREQLAHTERPDPAVALAVDDQIGADPAVQAALEPDAVALAGVLDDVGVDRRE